MSNIQAHSHSCEVLQICQGCASPPPGHSVTLCTMYIGCPWQNYAVPCTCINVYPTGSDACVHLTAEQSKKLPPNVQPWTHTNWPSSSMYSRPSHPTYQAGKKWAISTYFHHCFTTGLPDLVPLLLLPASPLLLLLMLLWPWPADICLSWSLTMRSSGFASDSLCLGAETAACIPVSALCLPQAHSSCIFRATVSIYLVHLRSVSMSDCAIMCKTH